MTGNTWTGKEQSQRDGRKQKIRRTRDGETGRDREAGDGAVLSLRVPKG